MRLGFLYAALAATPLLAAAAAPPAPAGLDLPGIALGMSLQAWRAAPVPGAPSAHVGPTCQKAGAEGSAGMASAAANRPSVVVCAYTSRYGRYALPETLVLGPKLQASDMRFTFLDGRLSRIEYLTSVDAYDDLVARLSARYGRPSRLIRDSLATKVGAFPRVRETWSTPKGLVQLVDPASSLGLMSVGLIARPTPAGRPS